MLEEKVTLPTKHIISVFIASTSVICLVISGGRFNGLTTIAGLTLLLTLHAFGRSPNTSKLESWAFSAIWSLCALLTLGWFLSLTLQPLRDNFVLEIGRIDLLSISLLAPTLWLICFIIIGSYKSQHQK